MMIMRIRIFLVVERLCKRYMLIEMREDVIIIGCEEVRNEGIVGWLLLVRDGKEVWGRRRRWRWCGGERRGGLGGGRRGW